MAQELDSKGYTVFATCYDSYSKGAQDLVKKCSQRLKVLKMDVTKDEDVYEAVLNVEKQLGNNSNLKDRKLYFDFKIKLKGFSNLFSDLWALVNNAGIINFVPIEWGKQGIDVFKNHMEVNALGQVRVTKAFLPLLRRTKDSRIVNVESLSGITQLIRKIT